MRFLLLCSSVVLLCACGADPATLAPATPLAAGQTTPTPAPSPPPVAPPQEEPPVSTPPPTAPPATPPPVPAPVGSCAPDNRGWEAFGHLIGSLHEHRGYSDGDVGSTPRDYFAQGKSLNLDFMGSSEHSDSNAPLTANTDCASPDLPQCVQPLPAAGNPIAPLSKWELTQQHARDLSDASFTAFRGFEWTSDRFGHINVFFSRNEYGAKSTEGYAVSMESFWAWLNLAPETLGGKDGVVVFNHPGREEDVRQFAPDPAYAYNDFAYRQPVDLRVVGIEMFGKGSAYSRSGRQWRRATRQSRRRKPQAQCGRARRRTLVFHPRAQRRRPAHRLQRAGVDQCGRRLSAVCRVKAAQKKRPSSRALSGLSCA